MVFILYCSINVLLCTKNVLKGYAIYYALTLRSQHLVEKSS